VFSTILLLYDAAQSGGGQAEGSVVIAPFRGEQRGRRGQATGKLWPCRGLPPSQASREGGGDRPATGTGRLRALAGRKGLATSIGSCRQALARRGQEEGADRELWSGGG
jgi:hypothetical protein